MSDMSEALREWNEIEKQKTQRLYDKNLRILKYHPFVYLIDQDGVVSFKTFRGTLYFYSAINILVFKNIIFRTGAKGALAFIKDITKGRRL